MGLIGSKALLLCRRCCMAYRSASPGSGGVEFSGWSLKAVGDREGTGGVVLNTIDTGSSVGLGGGPKIWRATRRTPSFNRANVRVTTTVSISSSVAAAMRFMAVRVVERSELRFDFIQRHVTVTQKLHKCGHVRTEVKPDVKRLLSAPELSSLAGKIAVTIPRSSSTCSLCLSRSGSSGCDGAISEHPSGFRMNQCRRFHRWPPAWTPRKPARDVRGSGAGSAGAWMPRAVGPIREAVGT